MKFDITTVINDMLQAVKGVAEDHWENLKGPAQQFFERRKMRLALMAELRISGELSEEDLQSRLEDEKLLAEAEFHALAALSKAMAQAAANAAIDVLNNAIKVAVNTAL